jgi:beta-galactosidase
MITEFNGHMYPTKSDQEQRQAEHVTRHLDVLNAAYRRPGRFAGAIGWCIFDYNTHKDFGSGDRICHHGVMDIFREPKFAAYAYASQCDPASASCCSR